jgi:SSS family transporter
MITSFLAILAMFTAIGLASVLVNRHNRTDYYTASGTVRPWLVGLSAVATNNSGYMFIGVIGYTYTAGMAAFWLMVAWISGDFVASHFTHQRFRRASEASGAVSYGGVLAHWGQEQQPRLQYLIGLISLVFLVTYAGAQLVAGSKALSVLLNWPLWAGAVIGAGVVSLYSLAGGIRASIWTDAAQSMVMVIAMGSLLTVAIIDLDGIGAAIDKLQAIDGTLHWMPTDLLFDGIPGLALFVLGWFFAGLSVTGQPHVMTRFMTLDNPNNMQQARRWYYLWFIVFYCMATSVGLLSRLYLPNPGSFDAELALPLIALQLLPDVLVGVILAGIFAATMSTADSLILSCSATLTHDLRKRRLSNIWSLRLATLLIVLCALGIALSNNESVFSLVIFSWSGLASAFVPLLAWRLMGQHFTQGAGISASLLGLGVSVLWRVAQWHDAIYEGLPGILAGLLVLSGYRWLAAQRGDSSDRPHLSRSKRHSAG